MHVTVFLRLPGLDPFINFPVGEKGVAITLEAVSQHPTNNTVKAYKISKELKSSSHFCNGFDHTDSTVIHDGRDFVNFRVKLKERSELLEMKLHFPESRTASTVFIPIALFNNPVLGPNPAQHVLPTENGKAAVQIDFLTSFPLPETLESKLLNFSSFSHDYFSAAENLVFGHRGMGITFKNYFRNGPDGKPIMNPFIENTIESFNGVAAAGGDGVEFDVVMTRDHVPIIYHDFYVCLRAETPNGSGFVKVPIHDLNYDDFRSLQLYHAVVLVAIETRPDLSPEMFRIPTDIDFSKLEEALRVCDSRLAFNLEIKYPQPWLDGEHECPGYPDRNVVVDRILQDMANFAGDRPIIISSFDFDTCDIMGSKQEIWPVAVLTQGLTKKWPPFLDVRTNTVESTSQFAKGGNFWGVSLHAEDLVADKSLMSYVRETLDLPMLVWGVDVNDAETAASLMPKNSKLAAAVTISDNVPAVVDKCK